MLVLGITGKSGSGKGYICARLEAAGIPVIDTDSIVHLLYRDNDACKEELQAEFGDLLTSTGEIDRKKLGKIVFSDTDKLKTLNAIVHRYVADEITRLAAVHESKGVHAILIDAPQLFEAHLEKQCDMVIAVTAPDPVRIERICRRDSIDEADARTRLASQLDDCFFESYADFVIVNDGKADIDIQIRALLDKVSSHEHKQKN